MEKVRDLLIRSEDMEKCFQNQDSIIKRVASSRQKLEELNNVGRQKYIRMMNSYSNAASVILKMKEDLTFIHKAVRKLNENTDMEIARAEYENMLENSKHVDSMLDDVLANERKSRRKSSASKKSDSSNESTPRKLSDIKQQQSPIQQDIPKLEASKQESENIEIKSESLIKQEIKAEVPKVEELKNQEVIEEPQPETKVEDEESLLANIKAALGESTDEPQIQESEPESNLKDESQETTVSQEKILEISEKSTGEEQPNEN